MHATTASVSPARSVEVTGVPWIWATAVLWGIPVVLSVAGVPAGVVMTLAMAAGAASVTGILFRPSTVLIALPFFCLLSPMGGFLPFGGRLLMSDALFVLLAAQCVFLFATGTMRLRPGLTFMSVLLVLFLVSFLVGTVTRTLVSLKPILYLAQLTIVYFYTRCYADHEARRTDVLAAWLAATLLGAVMLVWAYTQQIPLAGFELGFEATQQPQTLDSLLRATYYYTGFHFTLGISIVILALKLLFSTSTASRIGMLAMLIVVSGALFLMVNKTAIASVVVAVPLALAVLLPVRPAQVSRAFLVLAVVSAGMVTFVTVTFFAFLGDTQAGFWTARLFSPGSLFIRLEVYVHALRTWLDAPVAVVGGLGPDFLDSSGDWALAQQFKTSPSTGWIEGTVDSGWLSFLIEFGIVGGAALIAIFFHGLRSVRDQLVATKDHAFAGSVSVAILGGLIFVAVALTTQMLGYSKITWLPFQLLVFALMHAEPHRSTPEGT